MIVLVTLLLLQTLSFQTSAELSSLEPYYYSPENIEVTYKGSYEPDITWHIDGQVYSSQDHVQLTPSVLSAWSGSTIVFSLALDMGQFPATMPPFTVRATISFTEGSETSLDTETATVYKREFTQSLTPSITLRDGDFGSTFLCSASGENKDLLTLSWKLGQTMIDNTLSYVDLTDESDSISTTTKASKLKLKTNNPTLNNVLQCRATWSGENGKTIESTCDVNAIGASMEERVYSDGVMSCLVWGDTAPHSVTWADGEGETVSNVTDQTIITESTNGAVHTHTLTIKNLGVGEEETYTCSVVFVENDQPKNLVTTLNKLYVRISLCVRWFRFTCEYNGMEDPTKVEWYQESTEGSSNLLEDSDDKYTIRTGDFDAKSKSKTSVIAVDTMAVTDSGDYTCKWSTDSFNPEATMAVAIRSLTTPSEVVNSVDGTIKITCNFEGTTSGTIEWYHEGQKLEDVADDDITISETTLENHKQEYKLTITNVNPELHAGVYKCVLVLCDGDNLEAKTEVVARSATLIDTQGSMESYIVVSGDRLTARCRSQGDKAPSQIIWSKDGGDIEMDNTVKMHNTNTKVLENSVNYFSNLTIKNFAFSDEGTYKCTFIFTDGHNTEATVTVKFARVTNDECVFVDCLTETSKTLTCTYHGAGAATSVSFTRPDGSEVPGELSDFTAGSDGHSAGSQRGSYAIASVTDDESGLYRCTFNVNGGTTVSAVQRLTARKAVIETSEGKLDPHLIVQASLTLTCTVKAGAKSLEWFKDDKAMIKGLDYESVKSKSISSDMVSKIELEIKEDSAGSYKCVVRQADDFCPAGFEFESEPVVLTVITSAPLRMSSLQNVAYGGESHTFVCVFPNPYGDEDYEIVWSYKAKTDVIAMRMIADGDVTNRLGDLVIDGHIESVKADNNDEISTTLTIDKVNGKSEGEFICMIKWRKIFIKSSPSKLTVRTISSPPVTTNVVKGGAGQLNCQATGDSAATISFHRVSDHQSLGTVINTNSESNGMVTSTGVLAVGSDVTDSEDSIEFYCKASWIQGKEVKSDSVYLSILDITGTSETTWGAAGKVAEFNCQSHGVLRENGNLYLDKDTNEMVITNAKISWEFFDAISSTWKDIEEDKRFSKSKSLVGSNGIRVSPLLLQSLKETDDNARVRCTIQYKADSNYNFLGGTVMSGDLTLRLASITSFTSSDSSPTVGDTITLTCVATGEVAPTFEFSTDGRGNFASSLYEMVRDMVVSSTGTEHSVTYVTRTIKTQRNGQKIKCKAYYKGVIGTAVRSMTVTTYYDCSSLPIQSHNDAEDAVIRTVDNGDGTTTRTITCPVDTETTRYTLEETANSGASITCSKEEGYFVKRYLARCRETKALEFAEGTQIQTFSFLKGPCHPSVSGKYGKEKMEEMLNSDIDTVCGFRNAVSCLIDNTCELVKEETLCTWEDGVKKGRLYFSFKVRLTPPVWLHTERTDRASLNGRTIMFYDCSENYDSRKKRNSLTEMDFDFDSGNLEAEDFVFDRI